MYGAVIVELGFDEVREQLNISEFNLWWAEAKILYQINEDSAESLPGRSVKIAVG